MYVATPSYVTESDNACTPRLCDATTTLLPANQGLNQRLCCALRLLASGAQGTLNFGATAVFLTPVLSIASCCVCVVGRV